MRHGFIVALATCLTGAGAVLAEAPAAPLVALPAVPLVVLPTMPAATDAPYVDAPVADAPFGPSCDAGCPCGPRVWGSAEYLLWWIKDAPVPTPLVTAGPTLGASGGAGVIGGAGTATLLGGENVGFGPFSGGRFTLGAWLSDDQRFGIEGNYLFLAQQSKHQSVSSSGLPGSTDLGVPFLNGGVEDSIALTTGAGGVGGGATLSLSTKMQGAEFNTLFGLTDPSRPFQLHVLGGFRWLNLSEDLGLDSTEFSVGPPNTSLGVLSDNFNALNNFYGGQVGLRGEYNWRRVSVEATGKVAFGNMNERVIINGVTAPAGATPFPGGFFTEPSNIGSFHKNTFAYIPEGDLKVGYQITDHIQAFVGYSFLYASSVVRPGDQIDRNVNLTQRFGGTLTGPAVPTGQTNSTDFWAQGVNFGLEFKF